jgi:hypothetical protein
MTDAFVVIPSALSSYSIAAFTASYGITVSDDTALYTIIVVDAAGAVVSSSIFTHLGGNKVKQDTISPSISLGNGYSVFLDVDSAPDNGARGYTITLELSI